MGDVAELKGGYAFKSKDYTESGRFVLRTVNITDDGRITKNGATFISENDASEYERFSLKEHDTLFVMVGATLGKTGYITHGDLPALLNQNMWVVRSKNHQVTDPRFLNYWFSETVKSTLGWATGSARGFVRRDDYRSLPFPNISLAEQKRIAHILGTLDDKIALNREMNATLESMAQALFKSWFVDFDPVIDNALRAGNPIPEPLKNRAKTRKEVISDPDYHPSPHAHLFPDTFIETEDLGWIPEGWELSSIGDEIKIVGGGTPSTKNPEFWDSGIHYWSTPKDFSSLTTKIVLESSRKVTDAGLAKISSGLLPINSVLMSSRAPIGYLAINKVETAINQGFIGMICNKNLPAEYVIYWADSCMDDIKGAASGSTFAEISKKTFRTLPVLKPKDSIVKAFAGITKSYFDKIEETLKHTTTLTKLCDTLLPKLISGELSVPQAEQMLNDES